MSRIIICNDYFLWKSFKQRKKQSLMYKFHIKSEERD